ncbi:ligase-associated DNA damage response endonuclease PdeM [Azohydromonas sediminis]|uniref:ligase-associated DNA damage response endonuclease PdeM n=1 Tax=Azohydromonas sediminis TaxID=2259674 RepID=UPI000E64A5CC|nr:ligase-associated DNA damage response endonuclease PdeM [Azohydromonas sediminis]
MAATATVDVGGETLVLLPERAALLPRHATLLVADAHVGKAVSFRRLGVPVPRGTTTQTLDALSQLVERHAVARVVFLGDLLHSPRAHAASTLGALARWRQRHATLALMLVRGNHDDRAGDPPPALRIDVVDEPWRLGGLALAHHPRPVPGAYVLAGHLHPCVHLGRGVERLRLPCFAFGDDVGVLPAFGAFTGMHAVDRRAARRLFVVGDGEVLAIEPDGGLSRRRQPAAR